MARPPPPPSILLATCLLVCAAACVAAQCSTYGDEGSCYAQRATCRWDLPTNACVTGAPISSSCYQFNRDTTGCAGATSGSDGLPCQVNSAWNNMCYQPPMPCGSITGSDASCVARSDCKVLVSGVSCTTATTGASIPANQANALACTTAGYFWDAYAPGQVGSLNHCYGNGINEVTTVYPNCGVWSYYGGPGGDPCTSHGCSYDTLTGRCLALPSDGGASSGGSATSLVSSFSVSAAVLDMVGQTVSVQVSIPATQFFNPVKPRWHIITVGTPPSSSPVPSTPSVCNNLAVAHPAFGINALAAPTYADTYGLSSFFLSSAQAAHNISHFDGSTAAGAAVYQTIGRSKIGVGSSVVQSVVIPGTLDQVTQVVSMSLPGAVASCGATLTNFGAYSQYIVPISMSLRDGDNVAVTTMNQVITVGTYNMISVGATTRNTLTTTIENQQESAAATAYSAACPLGQKKRTWTIRESWVNPNPNTLVGLRNMSDISMVEYGYTQTVGSPTNCFGTRPVEVIPPTFPCSANTCVTLIKFESRCALMPAIGDGLNNCANQLPANMVADLGAVNGGVYSGTIANALAMVHDFYHYPKEWTDGNLGSAISVGQDVTGAVPDLAKVTIGNPVYPDAVSTSSLGVDCAFLPTPTSPLSAGVLVASTSGVGLGTSSSAYNIRNFQLASSGVLTTVCYLRNSTIRQSFTVTIDMQTAVPANMYTVAPLNSQGLPPSYSHNSLHYADIQHEMTYTPRQVATGTSLPLVSANIGIDGFSIPAYWLYKLLPSVGYVQQFYVSVSLPAPAGSVLAPTLISRRLLSVRSLLQTTDTDTGSVSDGAFSIIQDVNSTSARSVLSAPLGSTSSSIKTAAVVAAVVGGSVAIGVVGAFMLAGLSATAAASSSVAAGTIAAAGVAGRVRSKQYI